MYKFMVSAISVAFVFGLSSSFPSASSGQDDVRRLQKELVKEFAETFLGGEKAPVVEVAIKMVSDVLMTTAVNLCPASAEEKRLCGEFMGQGSNCRRRRSVTSDLEQEIIELLLRTGEDGNGNGQKQGNPQTEQESQQVQQGNQEQQGNPEQQGNEERQAQGISALSESLENSLAKALLQDEPLLPQSEDIQSKISEVIGDTLDVIALAVGQNCPPPPEKRLCGSFNADSSLCKRLCNGFNRNNGLC